MPIRSGEVRSLRTLEHVLGADPAVVRGFAQAAADRFGQGPLTLDARDRLLKRGQRLGLRRFDANLVLAAVEQRHSRDTWRQTPPTPSEPEPGLRLVWPAVGKFAATVLVVQGMIVAGAWWLLA